LEQRLKQTEHLPGFIEAIKASYCRFSRGNAHWKDVLTQTACLRERRGKDVRVARRDKPAIDA